MTYMMPLVSVGVAAAMVTTPRRPAAGAEARRNAMGEVGVHGPRWGARRGARLPRRRAATAVAASRGAGVKAGKLIQYQQRGDDSEQRGLVGGGVQKTVEDNRRSYEPLRQRDAES